jgi:hypothetical protein
VKGVRLGWARSPRIDRIERGHEAAVATRRQVG